MSDKKPTLILVHGAWHNSDSWGQLISYLEPFGYKCVTVDLPSVGPAKTRSGITIKDDVTAVRELILDVLGQGEDAIIISHSYGCVPSQAATSQLPSELPGNLLGMALIAALFIPPQTSVIGWAGGPAPMHDIDEADNVLFVGAPGPKELFYHDLPDDVAEKWICTIQPEAYSTISTSPQAPSSGFLDGIPTSYLVCTLDQALPLFVQQKMIADADALMAEKGFKDGNRKPMTICVEESVTGHFPFLGDTERVARCGEFVRRSAGENIPVKR